MPYNEHLDERIKKAVARWKGTDVKKMFGGVCHLLNGNMFGGVYKDYLIVRLGEEQAEKALKKAHARPFDITGKPMKGWVMVDNKGIRSDEDLKNWLVRAKDFVKTLPPK